MSAYAARAVKEIALLRRNGMRDGTWPSLLEALRCPLCKRDPAVHAPGEEDLEWQCRAAGAERRRRCGAQLSRIDHVALDRFPKPFDWLADYAADHEFGPDRALTGAST